METVLDQIRVQRVERLQHNLGSWVTNLTLERFLCFRLGIVAPSVMQIRSRSVLLLELLPRMSILQMDYMIRTLLARDISQLDLTQ